MHQRLSVLVCQYTAASQGDMMGTVNEANEPDSFKMPTLNAVG